MENWKVESTGRRETIEEVKIQRDLHLRFLFIIAMVLLRKCIDDATQEMH